jgi:uncharacterized protein YkwD
MSLKNFFLPHAGNNYHPHLFRRTAVLTLILAVMVLEGAYVADLKLVQNHEGFLASVLPAALLDLTNSDRASNGVAALQNDPALAQAAQLKANDMAEKGYFAHVSPDGKTPWYWLQQVGYPYTFAGENLAINFDDSSAVETAWMNSPTHRANIVKPQYTRVGYAVAHGTYQGRETTFVVQEFAARPNDATITATPKPVNPVTKAVDKVVAVVTPAKTVEPEPVTVAGPAAQTPEVAGSESNGIEHEQPAQIASTTQNTGQPMILASDQNQTITSDSWFTNFLKKVAASPLRTAIYLLGGLSVLMLLLLAFALFAHKNVRSLEVLGGGLIVIVFALSVLVYDATHALSPVLPTQAAAITAL